MYLNEKNNYYLRQERILSKLGFTWAGGYRGESNADFLIFIPFNEIPESELEISGKKAFSVTGIYKYYFSQRQDVEKNIYNEVIKMYVSEDLTTYQLAIKLIFNYFSYNDIKNASIACKMSEYYFIGDMMNHE